MLGVTGRAILRSKVKGQGCLEGKCENRFWCMRTPCEYFHDPSSCRITWYKYIW